MQISWKQNQSGVNSRSVFFERITCVISPFSAGCDWVYIVCQNNKQEVKPRCTVECFHHLQLCFDVFFFHFTLQKDVCFPTIFCRKQRKLKRQVEMHSNVYTSIRTSHGRCVNIFSKCSSIQVLGMIRIVLLEELAWPLWSCCQQFLGSVVVFWVPAPVHVCNHLGRKNGVCISVVKFFWDLHQNFGTQGENSERTITN